MSDIDFVREIKQVQEEGANLTLRPTINFIGSNVTAIDDPSNDRINVTITDADTDQDSYQMQIGGELEDFDPPTTRLGTEIVRKSVTLTNFRARRALAGDSGTTTIELEVDGSPSGYTLSWTSSDSNWALKSTVISVAVTPGQAVSLKLTSAEDDAEDIFAEVD